MTTTRETAMLAVIATAAREFCGVTSDKIAGADVESSILHEYTSPINRGVLGSRKSYGGIISSLSQKGLVRCEEEDGDQWVALTEDGVGELAIYA